MPGITSQQQANNARAIRWQVTEAADLAGLTLTVIGARWEFRHAITGRIILTYWPATLHLCTPNSRMESGSGPWHALERAAAEVKKR